MALANYLVQRGKRGTYQLRAPVPRALQAAIGKRERVQSMGTTDRDLAARKAMPILTQWLDDFDRAANDRVAANDVPTLAVNRTFGPVLEKLEASRRAVPDDDAAYSAHLSKREAELRRLTRWRQDGVHASWEAVADRMIKSAGQGRSQTSHACKPRIGSPPRRGRAWSRRSS
jgi:hypothetical protein